MRKSYRKRTVKPRPTLIKSIVNDEVVDEIPGLPYEVIEEMPDYGPESFGGSDYPNAVSNEEYRQIMDWVKKPIVNKEEEKVIKDWFSMTYEEQKAQQSANVKLFYDQAEQFKKDQEKFDKKQRAKSWIQTYSGRKFSPLDPYPDAIVIIDIAHSLSMQCRFTGHTKSFYSVAQHSVLVSYICDSADALWGLLHDASEAYLTDVPRPLKRSGKFDAYLEFEKNMQNAVCTRFNLPLVEPPSVKIADTILLATEARDLMAPLHSDWVLPVQPLPFKIESVGPQEAKNMFMRRFFELTNCLDQYDHYLTYENKK